MKSGSGWIEVIQPQAAGIARAAQMAAEPAAAFSHTRPAPAIAPTTTPPWKPVAQAPTPEPTAEADSDAADETTNATTGTKKTKRSTERGEGRVKLIAALTKHHKYADGGCLNLAPIGNNELARLAVVSDSTASAFFTKEFEGHTKYRALCGDATRLVASLKLLNQEFSPYHLFGGKPPDEDDRDAEH